MYKLIITTPNEVRIRSYAEFLKATKAFYNATYTHHGARVILENLEGKTIRIGTNGKTQ